jgi:PIN domain nuclease of toxin-antitoxin system
VKALLDTHALIWTMDATEKLGVRAEDFVTDQASKLLLSAATLWEIGIKVGLNKLNLSLPFRDWMTIAFADLNLTLLPITLEVADIQSRLSHHHKDPFDRLLVAQALAEDVPIVSVDDKLDAYGITRIW